MQNSSLNTATSTGRRVRPYVWFQPKRPTPTFSGNRKGPPETRRLTGRNESRQVTNMSPVMNHGTIHIQESR